MNFKKLRIYGIALLFIIVALSISLKDAKGAEIEDYLEIANASESVANTWVYGDDFYVLNDTTILKYYLENGELLDSYQIIDFMTSVNKVLRKGYEVYIDMTYSGNRWFMCFDLRTFEEMNRTPFTTIDEKAINDDVWNYVYYEFDGHGFWLYGYGIGTGADSDDLICTNMFKMSYDEIAPYENIGVVMIMNGRTQTGHSGAWTNRIYVYNTTSGSTSIFNRDMGSMGQQVNFFSFSGIIYNVSDKEWVESGYSGLKTVVNIYPLNDNYGREDSFNMQHEIVIQDNGRMYTYATFLGYSIRGDLSVEDIIYPYMGTWLTFWFWDLDSVNDEVIAYSVRWGSEPSTTFRRAYNREGDGFGGWSSFNINYIPNFPNDGLQIGQASFGSYETYTGYDNLYCGYVNYTNLVPIAERIVLASENDIVSSFDYDDIVECMIFNARLNLIATFTRIDDSTLYVLRNLIDRNELNSGGYTTPTLKFIDADLYTVVGSKKIVNDGWLFMGEIYQIESTIQNMTYYYLELDDGENTVRFFYNNNTKSLNLTSSEQFLAGLIYGEVETVNTTLEIYHCIWRFILNRNIVDIQGVSITYYGENIQEEKYTFGTAITGLKIYNLGGYADYDFGGDGSKIIGGDIFEVQATNGTKSSYAYAEMIFRKLQHVNMLVELDLSNEWDAGNGEFDIEGAGYYEFGIDYRIDSAWVEGWKVRIYPSLWNVGHHNGASDHDWVGWQIEWFNRGVKIKEEILYTNHWGYDNEGAVPDYHINRTSTQLWIDLWFNKGNASTVVGGRVNSYYYGMYEQGSAWWFGYGKFRPMFGDVQVSMFFDDLKDSDDDVFTSQKLDLIRCWVKVTKLQDFDGDDETWKLKNYVLLNWKQASDRMEGVDTPILVETKVLDMPSTGFINALRSAINGISTAIWKGAFSFLKLIMSSIGYLMEAIGLGEWWEAVTKIINSIAVASMNFMDSLEMALLNSALLLEQILRFVSLTLTRYTLGVTAFISSMIKWYQGIIDMFTGGGIWSINVWMSLSLEDWFTLALNLLPVWWAIRLSKADDIIRTIQGDLSFVISIVTGVYWFLTTIIFLSVELLTFLIGLLPI